MKKLLPVLALICLTAPLAFADGTEVSHHDVQSAADFFANDVRNFRIDSVELGKDAFVTSEKVDEACLSTAETTADCTQRTWAKVSVVHVDLSFDSDSPMYEDGGNRVTLSIPLSAYSAQELASLKKTSPYSKAAVASVKLNVSQFSKDVVNYDCGEGEGFFDCQARAGSASPSTVTMTRVSVSR